MSRSNQNYNNSLNNGQLMPGAFFQGSSQLYLFNSIFVSLKRQTCYLFLPVQIFLLLMHCTSNFYEKNENYILQTLSFIWSFKPNKVLLIKCTEMK